MTSRDLAPPSADTGVDAPRFTPGPWANDDSEIYQEGHSFLIAETSPLPGDNEPSGFSLTELANAQLIAAAPCLLEVLKAASDWLDWYFAKEPSIRTGPTRRELQIQLRAAILKATGTTPNIKSEG